MLKWNHSKVQQLSPGQIWLFIIGRVAAAFGIGILAMQYYPGLAGPLALPALIVGLILMGFAFRGFAAKK